MFKMFEEQYGVHTLWEWCKDYVQNEREVEVDERISLEEYLMLRAENYDEDHPKVSQDNMPEFSMREAIEEAIEILTQRATETDTASPEGWRVRAALATLSLHVPR